MAWNGKSSSGETVDFEDADFEVAAGAERRVVEREAAVGLAVANALVHPDGLALPS